MCVDGDCIPGVTVPGVTRPGVSVRGVSVPGESLDGKVLPEVDSRCVRVLAGRDTTATTSAPTLLFAPSPPTAGRTGRTIPAAGA